MKKISENNYLEEFEKWKNFVFIGNYKHNPNVDAVK